MGVAQASEKMPLNTDTDKISYSIGIDIGQSLTEQNIQINLKALTLGIEDAMQNKPLQLSKEELEAALLKLQAQMLEKKNEAMSQVAQSNIEQAREFLADNKTKSGIHTLDNGLQYRIIKSGEGPQPTRDDSVTTHYRGKLLDGSEFDSSYARGEPVQFPVTGVIPGWQEALVRMQPGAKWELFVPAELAYGERGVGNLIGPNAMLIFEIELLNIQPAAQTDNSSS
jgi:FKBP-type peptidyl-prolyl cis-trans isomerase FklB